MERQQDSLPATQGPGTARGGDASRHLEQIKALATAARRVMSAPDLASTLDTITGAAREIIGAHQAVCSLTRGPDWSQAINAVSLSDRYAAWRDYAPIPDGSGIYAWICEGNRTVRMTQADLEAHPRWRGFGDHAREHPPMRGWLAAAVVGSDGRNLGLVQLSDKEEGEFDEADEAVLVQLAQFAASAIERSQTEGALRGSEARFRELADNISQLAWMAEPSGAIFWYNQRWYDYTGTTLEEMQGWGWRDVHHPDHVDRVIAEVQAHWAAGIAWEGTYLLRSAQGEYRSFLTRAEPIRNEAGELVRWIGTNTDISERIRAEAENARLVAIVSSSSDAIVSVSAEDRRISTWNRAAEAMFGYTEAEAIGAPAGLLVPPDHRTEFDTERGVFERTMQDGQVRFDSLRRRKDGTLVDVSISATRMVSTEGRVIGVSAIFRDITERKRWEEHQRL
ncbi:MAG TPA: PAS domain S-box protein, partial [Microvirga sp.]